MSLDLTNEAKSANFAERSFSDRLKTMGSQAEDAFERWAAPRIFQRVGWDKSPLPRAAMRQLSPEIRHIPDYLMYESEAEGLFWVECIGTASSLGFKIRKTKLETQEFYRGMAPVFYWAFHSPSDSYAMLGWVEVRRKAITPKRFAVDGNAYYEIGVDKWTKLR